MERKVEWRLRDGRQATVTVALVTEERLWLDGDESIVPCCRLSITATVDGVGIIGTGEPETVNHPEIAAKIGKLAIKAADLAKINAAIAEAKQTPEWQAKVERTARAMAESKQYDEHQARMRRAMGE